MRCTIHYEDAALAVLCGGQGSRLGGVPKGLLRRQGRPLLAWQLEGLGRRFAERLVVLSHDPAVAPAGRGSDVVGRYAELARAGGARLIADRRPGKGAPAGLEAALLEARAPWIFLIGCDLPFVDEEVVAWLAGERTFGEGTAGSRGRVDAVAIWAPSSERGGRLWPEPLHAFYHRRCARRLGQLLDAGDPSFFDLLDSVPGIRLSIDALPEGAPARYRIERSLANVNTPQQLLDAGLERG